MKKLIIIIVVLVIAFTPSITALAVADEKPLERTDVQAGTGNDPFPPADPTTGNLTVVYLNRWTSGSRSPFNRATIDQLIDDKKNKSEIFYLGSIHVVIGEVPHKGIVDSNNARATGPGWMSFDLGNRAKTEDTVHIIIQRYGWDYESWKPLDIEPVSFKASPVSIGDKVFWVIDIIEYKAILNNLADRNFLDFYAYIQKLCNN